MSTPLSTRRIVAIGAAIISIFLLFGFSNVFYSSKLSVYTHTENDELPALGAHAIGIHTANQEHQLSDSTGKSKIRKRPHRKPKPEKPKEKLAYVTWLSSTIVDDADEDLENDKYFQATRILVWQLLHVPETRTKGIDVVVMVTPSVSESRRARLRKDGAIVHPVDFLTSETKWEHGEADRWNDIMTKLRAWEMTQYSRIMMLDGDTMLLHPLDGVFDDPAAQIQPTMEMDNYTALEGEAPLPSTYLLASLSEIVNSNHDFPPTYTTGIKDVGYFNAGFFMLAPSTAAFNYYRSLLNIPDSFDSQYMEQNLLNKAHHWDGPMPWKELSYTWNIREPNENDFKQGVVSVHEKWWEQPWIYDNQKVKDWLLSRRWEMKGWYTAYDMLFRNSAGLFLIDIRAKRRTFALNARSNFLRMGLIVEELTVAEKWVDTLGVGVVERPGSLDISPTTAYRALIAAYGIDNLDDEEQQEDIAMELPGPKAVGFIDFVLVIADPDGNLFEVKLQKSSAA